jgi:hypothetical protein
VADRRPLLELDVDGAVYGFVIDNEPVLVTLDDGDERAYVPGAWVDALPARSSPIGGGAGDQGAVGVTLQLSALDLWGLRESVPAQSVTGRLYFWPDGETLRPEHEIFRGAIRSPKWSLSYDAAGRQTGSVSFDLSPPTRAADVAFPPALVGDTGRFPDAPDASKGRVMPVVYGTVAGLQLIPVTDPSAASLINVTLLIAGHKLTSTAITVNDGDGAAIAGNPYTVHEGIDGRGEVYSYVSIPTGSYTDNLYAVSVTGWPAPDGAALDRLGDMLLHIWHTYAGEPFYELDRARAWGARDRLNRLRVGMAFDDRAEGGTVLRALAGRLEGQFPVVFGFAGGRFGWDATLFLERGDVVPTRTLTYGLDTTEREGPDETSVDDLVTEIVLDYAYDGFSGNTTATKRADRDSNGACRGAESRWGRSPIDRLSAPDVVDDGTAFLALEDQARRLAKLRYRVTYRGLDGDWWDVPLWEEVSVTDDEAGWSETAFVVEAKAPRMDGRVDVSLLERDGH